MVIIEDLGNTEKVKERKNVLGLLFGKKPLLTF
jgi:hypothetical protein